MKLYRRLALAGLALLLLLTAAACKVPLPGRPLLSDPPDASVSSPAVAIEADGTRHFAWVEPGGEILNAQGVTYYRVFPDGTSASNSWYPDELGEYYADPDLVVTDSGTAYLAYRDCTSGTLTTCGSYVVALPKAWGGAPLLPQPAGVGASNLTLVQRGGIVYLLGVNGEGDLGLDGSRVAYKQLAGGTRQGSVAWESGWFAGDPGGVIDSAGNLHVAFQTHNFLGTDHKVGYTSNAGVPGDMLAPVYSTAVSIPSQVSSPSISRSESNGAVFVAYAAADSPANRLYVWQPGTTAALIPLGPATDWQIRGSPALAAFGSNNYQVVFSASNSSTSGTAEMWLYDRGKLVLARLTDDTLNDGQPVVAKAFGVFDYPIFAWRTAAIPDPSAPGNCFGDVRVLTESQSSAPYLRTAFRDQGTCNNYGYDLAASGERALGAWLDVRPGSSVLEPWYSVDATETFLPAVRR